MDSGGEILPDYEGDCLYKVQGTVAEMLGSDIDRESLSFSGDLDSVQNVIVLLVDGFGYHYWKRNNEDNLFFGRLSNECKERKISSVFPSETATAMSSFYTGVPPSQHGLVGWYMFFENYDGLIYSLPFKTLEWEDAEEEMGLSVEDMYLEDSSFKLLEKSGVECTAVIPNDIEGGKVSNLLLEGASQVGYRGPGDMAVKLRKEFENRERGAKNYFFVYIPEVDSMSHYEGTESEEYGAQVAQLSHALKRNFLDKLDESKAEETALLMTADHGFINSLPEDNVDLFSIEGIKDSLKEDGKGEKIMPYGGPRNTHLRVKENSLVEVKSKLEEELDANIWTREEVLEKELFGTDPQPEFKDRLGDIIISGHGKAIWHGENPEELELIGHHGGLSRKEMDIPFIKVELEELVG